MLMIIFIQITTKHFNVIDQHAQVDAKAIQEQEEADHDAKEAFAEVQQTAEDDVKEQEFESDEDSDSYEDSDSSTNKDDTKQKQSDYLDSKKGINR